MLIAIDLEIFYNVMLAYQAYHASLYPYLVVYTLVCYGYDITIGISCYMATGLRWGAVTQPI